MVFQERTYGVLIVSAASSFFTVMEPLLPSTDYWPVVHAKSVAEAQRRLLEGTYDIVIINAPLPDDFGLRLAISTCTDSSSGVLLLVKNDLYNEIYTKAMPYGVLTLSKPTNSQLIVQSLRVLCATRERLRQMEQKQMSVEKKIEEIRLVNRAKWLLIECLGMKESDAHRYIEKQAMDLRISKSEMAENIIRTYKG
ncbi:MAG TPA: ANTAR domain-containing protein [Candidatus Faecousia faecavium]|nr:ANTAR domain-containing protein [Candidatus Faecousia faecavium]